MMGKFDLDSSISPHSSSQGDESANSTSMSICKSELLFSPVKETPMPGVNFSVDSLDCDMMLTCQANKDNYTIAFEGSVIMDSEDSDYNAAGKKYISFIHNKLRFIVFFKFDFINFNNDFNVYKFDYKRNKIFLFIT